VKFTLLTPRFQSQVFLTFSTLALVLAVIGIYGVLAYSVTQRRREFGVRVALGATPGDVMRIVLGRTGLLMIPGLVLGIGGALAATRVLKQFLFQIEPTDPATFVGVALLLGTVALLASYWPARRASQVDPLVALRSD
jgi:ABC-type antimicrobial peptide transport system permease subunit